MLTRLLRFAMLPLLLAGGAVSSAAAQVGRIIGSVTDVEGHPIAGAQVLVVGTGAATFTDPRGGYVLTGVPAGTHVLQLRLLGHRAKLVTDVQVRLGEDTRVNDRLEDAPLQLGSVVVSASRRIEKITDAPATVTRIDPRAIAYAAGGNGFLSALREAKGIDYIQTGVTAVAVNARGFNSSFNNRVLLMEDGRTAVIPEKGLPLGALSSVARVDLAVVEVIAGPGSALYGPDASNGVITVQSKDPRLYPGLAIEATTGSRRYRDVQARYAITVGAFGVKVAGERQTAADFENALNYGPVAPQTTRTPEVGVDWNTSVSRASTAVVYYRGDSRAEASAGVSTVNGVEQTSAGRNQLVGYQARHLQLRYTAPRLYATAYRLDTRAGRTFGTNAYSQNRLAFPALSDDSVRRLSDFPGGGTLTAMEVQGNTVLPGLAWSRLIGGVQLRRDQVTSEREWLSDRKTGRDIIIDQRGLYGQVESPLGHGLRVVLAARFDDHDRYGSQTSPKAALLWSPSEDQTVRVSVNRAYKAPTVPNMDFYAPNLSRLGPGLGLGMFGNQGFTVRDTAGRIEQSYDPIRPEVNTTYEVGYKGVVWERVLLDVTGYRSRFRDFLTPLTTINNPGRPTAQGGPTFAYDLTGARIVAPDGSQQVVLTYLNVGQATLLGVDLGIHYAVSPQVTANATYSHASLAALEIREDQTALRDATSLNAPRHKGTVRLDVGRASPWAAWIATRAVSGYDYRSGAINTGRIAGFVTTEFGAIRDLPALGFQLKASLQNVLGCSYGRYELSLATPPPGTYVATRQCGVGVKHVELINMPELGPMLFFGVLYAQGP
jgi:outer membrane receptor for ferrienterochelin and colicins